MPQADAAPAGIAVPMADASPIVALSWSGDLPRSSWCGPSVAFALTATFLPMDVAARSERIDIEQRKAPLARGFLVGLPVTATPAAAMPAPMPSAPAPVPATPTPMAAVPAPVTTPATMPAPAHLLRLQAIDFVARGDGGMGTWIIGELSAFGQRVRRQRCCLRAGRERRRPGRESKGEFQKVPAFHAISSSAIG
jgi:hypothetical protein